MILGSGGGSHSPPPLGDITGLLSHLMEIDGGLP